MARRRAPRPTEGGDRAAKARRSKAAETAAAADALVDTEFRDDKFRTYKVLEVFWSMASRAVETPLCLFYDVQMLGAEHEKQMMADPEAYSGLGAYVARADVLISWLDDGSREAESV